MTDEFLNLFKGIFLVLIGMLLGGVISIATSPIILPNDCILYDNKIWCEVPNDIE